MGQHSSFNMTILKLELLVFISIADDKPYLFIWLFHQIYLLQSISRLGI